MGLTTEDKAKVNVLEEYLWAMWNSLCQVCLKNEVMQNLNPKNGLCSSFPMNFLGDLLYEVTV